MRIERDSDVLVKALQLLMYLSLKFGIQMIVDCSKDERFSTCLPPIHTTLAEIFPPVDEIEKGTKIY